MKYDYIYTLGDKRKNIKISIVSNKKGNFTHVFGLDHLKESPIVIGNNLKQKEKIFSNIVNKKNYYEGYRARPKPKQSD